MTDIPRYDDWKTHNLDDDRCEHCGAHPNESRHGWAPEACTGKCRNSWRDPDYEYDRMRDEPPDPMRGVEFPFADNH